MDGLRQYIISVTAAGVLCAVIRSVLGEKGTVGALLKLVSGIFLAFVVARPLAKVEIMDASALWEDFSIQADSAAEAGENLAREAMADIIITQTQAYILDKGAELGLELSVQVTLDEDNVPVSVTITGAASPAARTALQNQIQQNLGIAKENQIWTG